MTWVLATNSGDLTTEHHTQRADHEPGVVKDGKQHALFFLRPWLFNFFLFLSPIFLLVCCRRALTAPELLQNSLLQSY